MILEAIDKLNVSKAPGPDGIHARIIKECKESFSSVFHVIFKKSANDNTIGCIHTTMLECKELKNYASGNVAYIVLLFSLPN